MPFINTKTNLPVPAEKEKSIKEQLGQAIRTLPGKSEQWLMVGFEPEYKLWFKGTGEPAAMVEVSMYGGSSAADYNKLTAIITEILVSTLGLAADRIFIKYAETPHWGWNGNNF